MSDLKKYSGLGRIRTGDLRRVKTPFRNWSHCCSSLNADCQLVKELQACNRREAREDSSASYRQTDSNNSLFLERTVEHSQCRVKEVPIKGLANLELQFDHDELVNYTEYRKTELTRKSADWIDRASSAFWLSTFGTVSAKTLTDLRKKTLGGFF